MPRMVEMTPGRRYDLWWEDPYRYHEHLRQLGESQVLFNIGHLRHRNPFEFMRQNFRGMQWRCIVTGHQSGYMFDYRAKSEEDVLAVWPAWDYMKYNLRELGDYIQNPWSEQTAAEHLSFKHHPLPTQPHRVIVNNVKAGHTRMQQRRKLRMRDIMRAYPDVDLFCRQEHFSAGVQFGLGYTSGAINVDYVFRVNNGSLFMPNGQKVELNDIARGEGTETFQHFGYDIKDIQGDIDNAIMFQIESYRYAAHHWDDRTGPFKRHLGNPNQWRLRDYHNPDMYAAQPTYSVINNFRGEKAKDTDKILCDSCSLWRVCPAYRSEAVCGLPGSETKKLSELAMSRDADDVVEMLARITKVQAQRVERKIEEENFSNGGDLDKDLDKMMAALFKHGVQLAKLRNPNLGRPLVQINAQVGAPAQQVAAIEQADPRAIGAYVVAEIEKTGVKREDITDEMMENFIKDNFGPQRELETIDAEIEQ